jgi:hypothetical protein
VLAVGLTLVITTSNDASRHGHSTTNVFELAQLRGGSAVDTLPIVDPAGDDWVTLVAYPSSQNFDEFRVVVERFERDASWTVILSNAAPVGAGDSLAVSLPRESLVNGEHRLRVVGYRDGRSYPALSIRFRVEQPSEG